MKSTIALALLLAPAVHAQEARKVDPAQAKIEVDPVKVSRSVDQAVRYLRSESLHSDATARELVLWTFLHAGVAETDPDFQKLAREMLQSKLERPTPVALQAMILIALDPAAHQKRIAECARYLIENETRWLAHESLALRLCPEAGIPLTPENLELIHRWEKSHPMAFRNPPEEISLSDKIMIAAIARSSALQWLECKLTGKETAGFRTYPLDATPESARKLSLSEHVTRTENSFGLPRLWAQSYLDQIGPILFGRRKTGIRNWDPEGARLLLSTQQPDGSWSTESGGELKPSLRMTCYAVLYLKRLTNCANATPTPGSPGSDHR